MTMKLLVSKHSLAGATAEDLSSIKDQLVNSKVAPPDVEIEVDPNEDSPLPATVTYGFPGNLIEGIGNAVGLSKCEVVGQLTYAACMGASGANPLICAGVAAAAQKACEG